MTLPPILVTGGTGTLGRQVVDQLRQAGRDVRVLTRHSRPSGDSSDALQYVTGDLATGAGLAAAVRGAATIVHCASRQRGDIDATRNLARAAAERRARHFMVGLGAAVMVVLMLAAVGAIYRQQQRQRAAARRVGDEHAHAGAVQVGGAQALMHERVHHVACEQVVRAADLLRLA